MRKLGRSGIRVSVVGLGANQFGGPVDEAGTRAITDRALDLGVNHIDTAETYSAGRSEELIGKALGSRRSEVVIATKTGAGKDPGKLSRERIRQAAEGSLRRLGTDHIDLYYLHFPDPTTPLEESLGALDELRREGKIRQPAISNHSAEEVLEAVRICERNGWAPPVATQNEYSLLKRDVQRDVVPAATRAGMSVIPYFPLAGGFLTGKYRRGEPPPEGTRGARSPYVKDWMTDENFARLERWQEFASRSGHSVADLAFAWLLADPAVGSVIAGATRPEQVEMNVGAAAWKLTAEEAAAL